MGFEGILNQIFQPYFYYSVIFLIVSFVCVKILTKYCSFIGQRTKSLLYIFPLALPLAVMLVAFPSTVIQTSHQQLKTFNTPWSAGVPFGPLPPPPMQVVITLNKYCTFGYRSNLLHRVDRRSPLCSVDGSF